MPTAGNTPTHEMNLSLFQPKIHFTSLASSIKKINLLAKKKQLNKAIVLCKQTIKEHPSSLQLATLYAKLLFWDHQPFLAKKIITPHKTYAPKLYQKIYTTWAIKKLKKLKKPSKKIQFISTLNNVTAHSYDIQWSKIDAYIKQKKFNLALRNAQTLSKKHPNSKELHERIASLLFWTKHYQKSLRHYTMLNKKYPRKYRINIKKVRQAIKQSKKKKKKKRKISKQIPFKLVVQKKQILTKKSFTKINEETKHMIGFGYENSNFSDERYLDNTKYIEMTMPLNTYTLYLKLLRTNRYNNQACKTEGELYPVLPKPHWGYLSFSLANNADFFSKYSIGWHHYYNWENWQWGVGYTFNDYKEDNINLLTGEYSYYFTDEYYFKQTFYYVPDNNSYALLNQIKYKNMSHLEGYINYTIAHSNEALQDSSLFTGTDGKTLELGLEYPFTPSTSMGISLSKEWIQGEHQDYTRTTNKLFLKFHW